MSDTQFSIRSMGRFLHLFWPIQEYLVDFVLEFQNGVMTGEGAEGIGFFVISVKYSTANGECSWVKQYVGRHAVNYVGFREGKGIWGTWIVGLGKGGFQIWLLSEGMPLELEKETETSLKPLAV
jgi:hypothetical protein